MAYAGNIVDGATVKYRVVRSANFPYWCWYRWGFNPTSPTIEITSGESNTNENGEFEIKFLAKEDKRELKPTLCKAEKHVFEETRTTSKRENTTIIQVIDSTIKNRENNEIKL